MLSLSGCVSNLAGSSYNLRSPGSCTYKMPIFNKASLRVVQILERRARINIYVNYRVATHLVTSRVMFSPVELVKVKKSKAIPVTDREGL
jgi:hypothetical protein